MSNLPEKMKNQNKLAVLKIMTGQYKGKQFRLLGGMISIGKSADNDIVLKNNQSCSEKHATISYDGGKGCYTIRSLDPNNQVVINNQTKSSHELKAKDIITIGNLEFVFSNNSSLPSQKSLEHQKFKKEYEQQKKKKSMMGIGFVAVICIVIGFVFLDKETKQAQSKKGLKTEQDILDEIEVIEALNKEEINKNKTTFKEEAARTAFLEGFRDYRKGYYSRALKSFENCTTIQKNHVLCTSYENKAKVQLERLIQKKVILGKTYKNNKQYEACASAFKSVEIMVGDSSSPIFKEAKANRELCQLKTKNKI